MRKVLQILKYCFLLSALLFMSCDNNNIKTNNVDSTTLLTPNQPVKIGFEAANPYVAVDKSPMDISYYPPNFPSEKMNGNIEHSSLIARIIYSRPQRNGREIFSDSLVKKNYIQLYGKEWRLGANEATEIEFFKPVYIQGNKISAGRYIIYCIPYSDKWVIKFNDNLFSWGLHMNTKKDILQAILPVSKTANNIEYFTMLFQKADKGADLLMAWGDIEVKLPINF